MIEYIINYHKNYLVDLNYRFEDPNLTLNKLQGYILSQDEIIKYILKNNLDSIDIKYDDKYTLQFTTINTKLTNIKISPLEPYSVHLLRLININTNAENIFDFDMIVDKDNIKVIFEKIQSYISSTNQINSNIDFSPMDYCTLCGIKLELKGLGKISHCKNKLCLIQSRHVVMDNKITDAYKKDPFLCEILIEILIEGTTHPKGEKIFNPLPVILNITNLNELKKLLINEEKNLNISNLSSSLNDIELYRKIGSNAYAIISNAIIDNYFSLSTIERFQSEILSCEKPKLLNNSNVFNSNVFDSKNIKFIGLNYSFEIESKFKKEYFLFHGTPLYSWYPIVKNGIKIMSGTEFQLNGAVFGNGVYLSDLFSMSFGYSSRTTTKYFNFNKNTTSENNTPRNIVGVFEIAENIEPHKKSNNIYVINNDKIILLRYLIVINGKLNSIEENELSNYFVKYLGSINKLNDKKSINIKNKRFSAELKLLNSNNKIANVDIIEETTNWKIELVDIGEKKIKLNIYFNDYPKFPPKILLESGLNNNMKKIICDDESNINISAITPSKWEVTTNLSKIVDIIHNYVINL